jgi:hypothetical protein
MKLLSGAFPDEGRAARAGGFTIGTLLHPFNIDIEGF